MAERESPGSAEERERGFLLAAELAGDRGAVRALAGLAAPRAAGLAALAAEFDALPREARTRNWREAAAELRRVSVEGGSRLPPRARALLAAEVPREVGARWLREAPVLRRGFVADEGLRAVVRAASVAAEGSADVTLAAAARGRGRRWLAAALRGSFAAAARDFVAGLDVDEAGAVLALARLPETSDPADEFTHDVETWIVAAARAASPSERVVALGVMLEALAQPATGGDRRVRAWRRLAREIAATGACVPRRVEEGPNA
jgi:hypothetical protein